MQLHDDVLTFWFGSSDLHRAIDADHRALWFGKAEATDQAIRDRFGSQIERAASGDLASWEGAPGSALALVLLLDQFTRNAFRGTARMFAYDEIGLRVARAAIARGFDAAVCSQRRAFYYLPLMHSEALDDQDRCIELFEAIAAAAPAQDAERAARGLSFAHLHRDIIVRFGRYPHRNAILRRETTAKEAEFLALPNSSF